MKTNTELPTEIKISDVSKRFLRYFKKNPDWGALHVVMEDGNWDSVSGLDEWAKERGDKEGAGLARILQQMPERDMRRLAEMVDRLASGEKLSAEEQDAEEVCEWCGGPVDDDGECELSYCKGNHGF